MTIVQLNEDNFNATVEASPFIVIDFWAEWCGPCKQFAPVFDAAAAKHPDIVFAKIDTDAEQGLDNAFNIRSIPTLMIIREKIMVVRESGALSVLALEKVIEHARILDLDDIRTELAAPEGDEDAVDW